MMNRKITCDCGNTFYYWTIRNFVKCHSCENRITVEPCDPAELEPEETEDGEESVKEIEE